MQCPTSRACPVQTRSSRTTRNVIRAAHTPNGPTIAIVGITGAVGQEFLTVMKERNFPYSSIKMLASARSAGKTQEFEGVSYTIEELTDKSFAGVDIALFSAGGSISKTLGPVAAAAGCVVVDNSSAFRMTPGVPLVIPEVNPQAMAHVRVGSGGAIIANPNCSTIIALMAVTPLHRLATVKRMVVSTYQAASGAGAAAMEELKEQTRDVLEGRPAEPKIFPQQYAFNLFSHNSGMDVATGYNEEEDAVRITATCVRVPVMRAHAESINLEFENDISEEAALAALAAFPGVSIINDRAANRFPTPLDATFQDNVFVGRVRRDMSRDDAKGLDLFVCGDQIKKGAALNAIQIAEQVLRN
ncbi:MAG: hypothetical protein WDW36_001382 [Sanguina aurantia]